MTLVSFETKLARFRAAQARRKDREEKWKRARIRKRNCIRARRYVQRKKREAREAREELRFVLANARAVSKKRATWRRVSRMWSLFLSSEVFEHKEETI
jgi:hypothetical protein